MKNTPENFHHFDGGEQLFAVMMPEMNPDRYAALQAVIAAYGGSIALVTAAERATYPDNSTQAVLAVDKLRREANDQEVNSYLTAYMDFTRIVSEASSARKASFTDKKPFSEQEQKAFKDAGYRSVTYMQNFGKNIEAKAIVHENVGQGELITLIMDYSYNGTLTSRYTYKVSQLSAKEIAQEYKKRRTILGSQYMLQPAKEGSSVEITANHLTQVTDKFKRLERVENGHWSVMNGVG